MLSVSPRETNYQGEAPAGTCATKDRSLAPHAVNLRGSQEAGSECPEEAAAVSGTLARRPVAAGTDSLLGGREGGA